MTSSSNDMAPSGRDPVLRTAIAWHVRLAEEPDDRAAQREFDAWLAEDAAHADAWSQACRTMGLLEQGRSVAFLSPGSGRTAESASAPLSMPTAAAKRRWRGGYALPAVTAVAAAILFAVAPTVALHWQADRITGTGEARTIALSDGSSVRMAPGSAIAVRYAAGERHVDLLAGEAYFEVAPNRARPFRVTAKSTQVTVLGTGFDVRLGDAGADIAVRHGRVRVDDDDRATGQRFSDVLTKGDWVRLGQGHPDRGHTVPDNVGSWSGERLIAVGQPLREVIADLRRYHRGAIIMTDAALGDRIVTGSYDVRDPGRAVETILGPLNARVMRITPWIIMISPA